MTTRDQERFSNEVGQRERQKLKSMREDKRSVWAGLGTFGMVGWSIAVPTLLGTALGLWLDKRYPASVSWTLTFLISGLLVGCLIAWQWVAREHKLMHQDKNEENE